MLPLILTILSLVSYVFTNETAMCTGNHTLLEAPGDAVISVFVDTNYGPYCNETTSKGFQEVSTALYVVQTLNKYDYVPGLSLGLKFFDTCHDRMTVYKQALREAVSFDCLEFYELGILVPSIYNSILKPLGDYDVLPVSVYRDANTTSALVDSLIEFLATRYEVVDLLLVDSHELLSTLLDSTRDAGICVKSVNEVAELDNDTEALIVLVGTKQSVRTWIEKGDDPFLGRKTWVVLPIDDFYIDDIPIPWGSFVIKSEDINLDLLQDFSSVDDFLSESEYPVIHSPYLLSVGKSIIRIARILIDLQRRTCPHDETCILPRFRANDGEFPEVTNAEVYEALHILPKSHTLKLVASIRNNPAGEAGEEFTTVASYSVNVTNLRVTPEKSVPRMSKLCVKKAINKCRKCANFKASTETQISRERALASGGEALLKNSVLVPIFLTVMACGTLASLVIAAFIVYRYFTEQVLDGNPSLTIFLVVAVIFVLQTVLPFCIDEHTEQQRWHLNSRKILVSTLSVGITFSIMLSRAFFLAFSTGGVITSHINGYLQGLMVFFMAAVQVAISTMYFLLSNEDPSKVVRSLKFVALLSYDIFLLFVLFVVCCFVAQIQRNYREGKCFFGTVIGLLIAWAVWLTCFSLVEVEMRDTVVCSGMIATGYIIIIGILIPRTYYMMTRITGGKNILRRYETTDFGPDPRTNTIARQLGQRTFYEYAHPMEIMGSGMAPVSPRYPNYYGISSLHPPYTSGCGPVALTDPTRPTTYNNYAYHPDMQEVENPYFVPRVRIENPEGSRVSLNRQDQDNEVCYAQPTYREKPKIVFREHNDCIETDVYVEDRRLSPGRRGGPNEAYPSRTGSPRLYQSEETIREEEDNIATRITKL